MSWRVNQVQDILLPISLILHLDGMTLNRDTTFTFKIHIIKHLTFSYLNRVGCLQQPVGKGRFAVIYMGYNAKVSYMIHALSFIFNMQRYNKKRIQSNNLAFFCNYITC